MKDKQILSKYLPPSVVDKILLILTENKAILRISKTRASKLGDYRPPANGQPHRISVNHDLNPYEFLITLIHEIAHMKCWQQYGKKAKPHGQEWNMLFKKLLNDFNKPGLFPENISEAINFYTRPDTTLQQGQDALKNALKSFEPDTDQLTVEGIPNGETFVYRNQVFEKIEKARKRIKCRRLKDNRLYAFDPLVGVLPYIIKR